MLQKSTRKHYFEAFFTLSDLLVKKRSKYHLLFKIYIYYFLYMCNIHFWMLLRMSRNVCVHTQVYYTHTWHVHCICTHTTFYSILASKETDVANNPTHAKETDNTPCLRVLFHFFDRHLMVLFFENPGRYRQNKKKKNRKTIIVLLIYHHSLKRKKKSLQDFWVLWFQVMLTEK